MIDTWPCEYCDVAEQVQGYGSANRESLAQLLWTFFEYWAWTHDYARDVSVLATNGSMPPCLGCKACLGGWDLSPRVVRAFLLSSQAGKCCYFRI